MLHRRPDNLLITGEQHQVVDVVALEEFDHGIPLFGGDGKAPQGFDVGYATDFLVEEDRNLQPGVGFGKIQPSLALLGLEDGVDDVEPAFPHPGEGIVPIHGHDLDPDAGLAFPQPPLVDEQALDPAIAAEKDIGGIVVVHHHPDRLGRIRPFAVSYLRTGGIRTQQQETHKQRKAQSSYHLHPLSRRHRLTPHPPDTRQMHRIRSLSRLPPSFFHPLSSFH